jgi:hypothetical protein
MRSGADWSQRCVSNDARIALCSAAASSTFAFVGSCARNSSLSESSSYSPYGGAGSCGSGSGGGGAVVVVAYQNHREGACRRLWTGGKAFSTVGWRMRTYLRGGELFIAGSGVGKRRRRAESGRKRTTWHSFPTDAFSDATARCVAAKLVPFSAPLLGAGDETSGDDDAAGSSWQWATWRVAPSRRPRSPPPPPWTGFGSGAPDENVHRAG